MIDDTFSQILSNTYGFAPAVDTRQNRAGAGFGAGGHVVFNHLTLAKCRLAAIIWGFVGQTRLTSKARVDVSVAGSSISHLLNTAPMFRHGQLDDGTKGAVSVGAMVSAHGDATKILTVL